MRNTRENKTSVQHHAIAGPHLRRKEGCCCSPPPGLMLPSPSLQSQHMLRPTNDKDKHELSLQPHTFGASLCLTGGGTPGSLQPARLREMHLKLESVCGLSELSNSRVKIASGGSTTGNLLLALDYTELQRHVSSAAFHVCHRHLSETTATRTRAAVAPTAVSSSIRSAAET